MPLLLAVEAFGFKSGLTDLPLYRFGASLLSWAGLVATFLSIPLLPARIKKSKRKIAPVSEL